MTSSSELCTRVINGTKFITQDWFYCNTCGLNAQKNSGICFKCVKKCHANHDVGLIRTNGSSFCDCKDVNCLNSKPIATDDDICTYRFTNTKYITQDWYHCNTCNMKGSTGCCSVCAAVCHQGHDIVLHTNLPKHGFYCDCGAGSKCIALKPRASAPPMEIENGKIDERHLCIICMERPRSMVMLPCKHLVCCLQCSPALKGKCPVDRQDVKEVMQIYIA